MVDHVTSDSGSMPVSNKTPSGNINTDHHVLVTDAIQKITEIVTSSQVDEEALGKWYSYHDIIVKAVLDIKNTPAANKVKNAAQAWLNKLSNSDYQAAQDLYQILIPIFTANPAWSEEEKKPVYRAAFDMAWERLSKKEITENSTYFPLLFTKENNDIYKLFYGYVEYYFHEVYAPTVKVDTFKEQLNTFLGKAENKSDKAYPALMELAPEKNTPLDIYIGVNQLIKGKNFQISKTHELYVLFRGYAEQYEKHDQERIRKFAEENMRKEETVKFNPENERVEQRIGLINKSIKDAQGKKIDLDNKKKNVLEDNENLKQQIVEVFNNKNTSEIRLGKAQSFINSPTLNRSPLLQKIFTEIDELLKKTSEAAETHEAVTSADPKTSGTVTFKAAKTPKADKNNNKQKSKIVEILEPPKSDTSTNSKSNSSPLDRLKIDLGKYNSEIKGEWFVDDSHRVIADELINKLNKLHKNNELKAIYLRISTILKNGEVKQKGFFSRESRLYKLLLQYKNDYEYENKKVLSSENSLIKKGKALEEAMKLEGEKKTELRTIQDELEKAQNALNMVQEEIEKNKQKLKELKNDVPIISEKLARLKDFVKEQSKHDGISEDDAFELNNLLLIIDGNPAIPEQEAVLVTDKIMQKHEPVEEKKLAEKATNEQANSASNSGVIPVAEHVVDGFNKVKEWKGNAETPMPELEDALNILRKIGNVAVESAISSSPKRVQTLVAKLLQKAVYKADDGAVDKLPQLTSGGMLNRFENRFGVIEALANKLTDKQIFDPLKKNAEKAQDDLYKKISDKFIPDKAKAYINRINESFGLKRSYNDLLLAELQAVNSNSINDKEAAKLLFEKLSVVAVTTDQKRDIRNTYSKPFALIIGRMFMIAVNKEDEKLFGQVQDLGNRFWRQTTQQNEGLIKETKTEILLPADAKAYLINARMSIHELSNNRNVNRPLVEKFDAFLNGMGIEEKDFKNYENEIKNAYEFKKGIKEFNFDVLKEDWQNFSLKKIATVNKGDFDLKKIQPLFKNLSEIKDDTMFFNVVKKHADALSFLSSVVLARATYKNQPKISFFSSARDDFKRFNEVVKNVCIRCNNPAFDDKPIVIPQKLIREAAEKIKETEKNEKIQANYVEQIESVQPIGFALSN
jgi:hypothetical protein